jgi:hypothetical protein
MDANAENKQAASKAQEMVDGLRQIFGPLCERLKPEIEPAVVYRLEPRGEGAENSE